MKKIHKYITTILVNFAVLLGLLRLWIDPLELALSPGVFFNEIFKIIGFSILSLIGLRILVIFFRKRNIQSVKQKIKYATLLTVVICSYLYIGYAVKIINNRFLNNKLRTELLDKTVIQRFNRFYNTFGKNLNIKEYRQIARILKLPKLQSDAKNIGYVCSKSGSLGYEYSISVTYNLPLGTEIEEVNYKKDDFVRIQSVDEHSNYLQVKYEENWF